MIQEQKKGITRTMLALLFLAVSTWAMGSAYADDGLCITDADHLTHDNTGNPAPTIDGSILNDPGWVHANQYTFGNGTTTPDGTMQMVKKGNTLYISFQVNHDPQYNAGDKIILLFGPDNDPAHDVRIHIHPVSDSGNACSSSAGNNPSKVSVWRNSTNWDLQNNSSWLDVKVCSIDSATDGNTYDVEMAIPIVVLPNTNGINLPSTGDFKLYVNALRLNTVKVISPDGSTTEKTEVQGQVNWPSDAFILGVPKNPTTDQLLNSPARDKWGNACLWSTNSPCSGVSVKKTWINDAANTGLSKINPPPPGGSVTNNYFVELQNTGSMEASKVIARVKTARFGLQTGPDGFAEITTLGPSGVIPPVSSMPNNTVTLNGGWTLTDSLYKSLCPSSNPNINCYVCSFVQLDEDPSVRSRQLIANRYFYWNTVFGHASTFEHTATLATRAQQPAAKMTLSTASATDRYDIVVFNREVPATGLKLSPTELKTSPKLINDMVAKRLDRAVEHELNFVNLTGAYKNGSGFYRSTVCGYRHTGRFIKSDNTEMELLEETPCYSYWIEHKGEIHGWKHNLTGDGLVKIKEGRYTMTVPKGRPVNLATRIEAIERPTIIKPKAPIFRQPEIMNPEIMNRERVVPGRVPQIVK
ncbi:MAG TPA: hypothetical protein VN642_15115 [Dongiaceae bacterium]|nr:hypothetical protein [Dongiaceae bacterium]